MLFAAPCLPLTASLPSAAPSLPLTASLPIESQFPQAILELRGWDIHTWDALYEDLPSRQTKLAVKDRTALTVTADETRAIAPPDLQPALDALAAAYPNGRCFVRPSYACCGSNPRLLSPPVRC